MRMLLRLTRTTALLAAGAAALTPSLGAQQQDFSAVQIRTHPVAGTFSYLEGQGGNIGVSVGEDGVVMIDDQFAPLSEKILAAIHGLSDGDIRFLINTHVHPDHTGGNANFGRMGIVILARDEVRVRLLANQPKEALPILTFDDPIAIHLNGEDVRVIPVAPAHTDGDSYVYFTGSDVIHSGDVFRTTGFPYIDLGNGGTLQGTIDALGVLIGLAGPNTKIVPGHGVPSTREDVTEFRDMILDVKGRVAAMVGRGMTYDQVSAANPTGPYRQKWTDDPDRFLRAVYSEVGGQS